MTVTLLVAMARDGLIGAEGRLPWHLPADLKRFRRLTLDHPIIMGRRTYESIGRPLDRRTNIVLSRSLIKPPPGRLLARSFDEALALAAASGGERAPEEVFVIGGAAVFRAALPVAGRIDRTIVEGDWSGDVFFPNDAFDPRQWRVVHRETRPADARNPQPHVFEVLERVEAVDFAP